MGLMGCDVADALSRDTGSTFSLCGEKDSKQRRPCRSYPRPHRPAGVSFNETLCDSSYSLSYPIVTESDAEDDVSYPSELVTSQVHNWPVLVLLAGIVSPAKYVVLFPPVHRTLSRYQTKL